MAVHTPAAPLGGHAVAAAASSDSKAGTVAGLATPAARGTMAVARIVVGFIFLWAFIDKTFGLGYSTEAGKGWIDGNSPTAGFLTKGATGPLASFYAGLSGPVADVLFMLGMLAVGTAVILGIGTRIAAIAGTLIMAMMWLAEWPMGGNGATNPIFDYHWVYALVLILTALTYSGRTFGLGGWWEKLVGSQRWLV